MDRDISFEKRTFLFPLHPREHIPLGMLESERTKPLSAAVLLRLGLPGTRELTLGREVESPRKRAGSKAVRSDKFIRERKL